MNNQRQKEKNEHEKNKKQQQQMLLRDLRSYLSSFLLDMLVYIYPMATTFWNLLTWPGKWNETYNAVRTYFNPILFLQVYANQSYPPPPAGIYLLKVNNRNTRTRCEICSKLTIKIIERRQVLTLNM